ncbi:type II toxin-antitoxin system VapC family toxin [Nocardioides sp. AE5]|uniref:type II toxin-antitoxin system VapC family toxin n=1 Tax=Nocardioides sp. AE5 TaxID=2962573 RepID=UPI002881A380|nr:type II toxin-antitoxin system VapC family toxin [Nocardioides sp. AE5]MDT0202208.1 type II toxin-antitoxin system VapC family toxin [Nocardioides sp. AE5]
MTYLLDTNVVSELRRRQGSAAVKAWVGNQRTTDLFLSVITILEIETGILAVRRHDPHQANLLQRWLEHAVLTGFADRILPLDLASVRRVAPLPVPARAPAHDALIAGTALAHGMVVVTRNLPDFEGVERINPWDATPA